MRVPIPVVILIGLLTSAGMWWLRTKDMDFMTPRGTVQALPHFMTDLGNDDPATTTNIAAQVPDPNPGPQPSESIQPALEFGDLESSPGLAEYSEHATKGAGYLIRLATELEVRGRWERALLAWERVIDSCRPSAAERQTAEDAIVRIRPTLTHWNIDPAGDLPIFLQLGTSRPDTENLKQAAQQAAEFLRHDSDDILLCTPQITTSRGGGSSENAPIAIYFSGSADNDNPNLRSIAPEGDDLETYLRLLLHHSYLLVRQQLGSLDNIVPPETPGRPDEPTVDFERQVTRLHWKLFGESLNQPPSEGED